MHYDEAFSSLQVPHFKGFCRFHITRSGDLEMYSLGLDKVGSMVCCAVLRCQCCAPRAVVHGTGWSVDSGVPRLAVGAAGRLL